jgi:hypothetical protein
MSTIDVIVRSAFSRASQTAVLHPEGALSVSDSTLVSPTTLALGSANRETTLLRLLTQLWADQHNECVTSESYRELFHVQQ